jgi:hypothetical protein
LWIGVVDDGAGLLLLQWTWRSKPMPATASADGAGEHKHKNQLGGVVAFHDNGFLIAKRSGATLTDFQPPSQDDSRLAIGSASFHDPLRLSSNPPHLTAEPI